MTRLLHEVMILPVTIIGFRLFGFSFSQYG